MSILQMEGGGLLASAHFMFPVKKKKEKKSGMEGLFEGDNSVSTECAHTARRLTDCLTVNFQRAQMNKC